MPSMIAQADLDTLSRPVQVQHTHACASTANNEAGEDALVLNT